MKQMILALLIGGSLIANAQDIKTSAALPLPTLQNHPAKSDIQGGVAPGFKHKTAFTVFAGTQGFGGDLRYGLLPKLSIRLGAGVTPVNAPNAFRVNDFNSSIGLNVNFTNTHLIADFEPFHGSGLRLAFGLGYFMQAHTTADIKSGGGQYGNISLTSDQMGDMNITASWQGIAPYLGLGLFRVFPRRFFNINIDLGTYYLTAPKTTIVATGALQPNESNNDQLQQNISSYRWLPVLQFNFNFKL